MFSDDQIRLCCKDGASTPREQQMKIHRHAAGEAKNYFRLGNSSIAARLCGCVAGLCAIFLCPFGPRGLLVWHKSGKGSGAISPDQRANHAGGGVHRSESVATAQVDDNGQDLAPRAA